jgi:DNA polymerase III psi subunit
VHARFEQIQISLTTDVPEQTRLVVAMYSLSTDALRRMVSQQKSSLPLQVQQCINGLPEHIEHIEDNINEYDRILSCQARIDHLSQRLMKLKRIVPTRPVRWSPVSVMHTI